MHPTVESSILLVEDDLIAAQTLRDVLGETRYRIRHVESGAEGLQALRNSADKPDLIILDLGLPDTDGLILMDAFRAAAPGVPILICSGSGSQRNKVLGLKLGADDFVTKPFDVDEMRARVEAVLRRSSRELAHGAVTSSPTDEMQVGQMRIDQRRCQVTIGTHVVPVTASEYRLLLALASRVGEVLSREELIERALSQHDSDEGSVGVRTIDVHVRRLRVKLAEASAAGPAILAVRSYGYMLTEAQPSTGDSLAAATASA